MSLFPTGVEIYTTCPPSKDVAPSDYLRRVLEVSAWSDDAGCAGMLIYTDNSLVDPWILAQAVLQGTSRLCPLVAVQPVYMHPYTAAKMVASLAFVNGRRICLNVVAGGFRNDLLALDDQASHDERYARAVEYSIIIRRLLEDTEPVNFPGHYYNIRGLRMIPPLPPQLFPRFLMAGSSEASRAAAAAIGATGIEYPRPAGELPPQEIRKAAASETPIASVRRGIRVGVIARADPDKAWRIAWARFPEDRRGRLAHALASGTSDSCWHRALSELARQTATNSVGQPSETQPTPYWLWPFENHKTFCPYLVGDYESVAGELARYLGLGYSTFVLDVPHDVADLESAATAFRLAAEKAAMVGAAQRMYSDKGAADLEPVRGGLRD